MRITFLLTDAYRGGGTVRTTLTMASQLATRHQVEVVSVRRSRGRPRLPVDPRLRIRALVDVSPRARARREAAAGPLQALRSRAHDTLERVPSRLAHPADVRYSAFSARTDLALIRFLRSSPGDVLVGTRPSLNLILARHAPAGALTIGQEHFHLAKHPPALRAAIRADYPRLGLVATLTEPDAEDYRGLLGPGVPVVAVPNAVPDTGGALADPGAADVRLVVAAGRLVGQKGFDRLVDAFAGVHAVHPDWRLDILGAGPGRAALAERITLAGLDGVVTLRGFDPAPHRHFARAGIYALSSRREGLPMVLLEAMGCGLPLVAMDCPTGPSTVITEGVNGLLVPDGDVAGLARALIALIEDPAARSRMGAAGLRRAADYAPERIAARWEALIAELLDRRPLGVSR